MIIIASASACVNLIKDKAISLLQNKQFILFIFSLMISAHSYADSGSIGTRLGVTSGHDGRELEVYGRAFSQYLMAEASIGYGKLDYVVNGIPVTEIDQYSYTAILGIRLPFESTTAYIGGGAALIDNDLIGTFGSPIFQAGVEYPLGNRYLSIDYKYQFNKATSYFTGGIGVTF